MTNKKENIYTQEELQEWQAELAQEQEDLYARQDAQLERERALEIRAKKLAEAGYAVDVAEAQAADGTNTDDPHGYGAIFDAVNRATLQNRNQQPCTPPLVVVKQEPEDKHLPLWMFPWMITGLAIITMMLSFLVR